MGGPCWVLGASAGLTNLMEALVSRTSARLNGCCLISWKMPVHEGPRTTVFELGKNATNLLEPEQRLSRRDRAAVSKLHSVVPATEAVPLPPLDQFSSRIEAILRRKGQVVLYGPAGTGKTYRALAVANEPAARHAFRKSFANLTVSESKTVAGGDGLVRVCTFHPGWGYEDFIEGLRPRLSMARWFLNRATASSSVFALMQRNKGQTVLPCRR